MPLRLADTANGAPFFANSQRLAHGTRWRRLDYVEILGVFGGEGRLVSQVPGMPIQSRRLLAGSLIMLRPGEDPLLGGVGPEGVELRYVSFSTVDWRAYVSLTGLPFSWATAGSPVVFDFDPADPAIGEAFDLALQRYHDEPTPFDLVRFLVAVTPLISPRPSGPDAGLMPGSMVPPWLTTSLEAMHEEENLRAGVPRMLRLAHVSAPYLASVTRRYLGTTPTALVMDLRLRHAAYLLLTTAESIGAISRRCGFSRVNYFSTCFHQARGMSPRAFRMRAVGGPDAGRA